MLFSDKAKQQLDAITAKKGKRGHISGGGETRPQTARQQGDRLQDAPAMPRMWPAIIGAGRYDL